MLIRTQDKRSLVDMTGMTIGIPPEGVGSKSEIRAIPNHTNSASYNLLGTYSTEEKAIKVLDMIQKRYIDPIDQDVISSEYATIVYQNKVFEMPEDLEV